MKHITMGHASLRSVPPLLIGISDYTDIFPRSRIFVSIYITNVYNRSYGSVCVNKQIKTHSTKWPSRRHRLVIALSINYNILGKIREGDVIKVTCEYNSTAAD